MVRRTLLVVSLAISSCHDRPVQPPPTVLWSGCGVTQTGCEVATAPLVVWIENPWPGRFAFDGVELEPKAEIEVDGGVRSTFVAERFRSRGGLTWAPRDGEVAWSLSVEPSRLLAAQRLGGDMATEGGSGTPDDDDDIGTLARLQRARRRAFSASDPVRSKAAVEPVLADIVELATKLGRWGDACEAATVGLYFAAESQDADGMQRWAELEEPCRAHGSRGDDFDYYLGLRASDVGNYDEAISRLRRVSEHTHRLGTPFEPLARRSMVTTFVRLGHWAEAADELARLATLELELDPCDRADLNADVGYHRVVARQQGEADLGDPVVPLQRALKAHDTGGECENIHARNHDLIKLGYAAAQAGDVSALRRWLAEIDEPALTPKYTWQQAELKVELALASGDGSRAAGALQDFEAQLIQQRALEPRWRAHMLRARLAQLREDPDSQARAYADAEATLDEPRGRLADGSMRDRWLAVYRRSALAWIELLLAQRQLEAAACVARRARVRGLEAFTTQPTGERSGCPRPWQRHARELVLLVVPRRDAAWWVFVVEHDAVTQVRELPPLGDDPRWWSRFDDVLERNARVRILPSQSAVTVDFHAASWRGRPLIASRPVEYGLDLAASEDPWKPDGTEPRAAVVFSDSDPLRALGRYANDVVESRSVLDERGWSTRLEGPEVTLAGMREVVASSDLLHYFGHGTREDEARVLVREAEVGSTALTLAGGDRLRIEDVLGASRVPRHVVLLGCRLGHADALGWSGGLNLADAFLLAGTQQVLASPVALEASSAARLGPRLFADVGPGALDLAVASSRMWAQLDDTADAPHWTALRVWSR